MKKEHIKNYDLIRCVCAVLVVAFHYATICYTTPEYAGSWWGAYYKNGNWGETAVIAFFMLSGASLKYNYPVVKLKDLGKFYLKRLLGVLPMFYIAWLSVVVCLSIQSGSFIISKAPASLLLTLFGVDGYLGYLFPHSYYMIGEWFLGALIILYLLYPLLVWLFAKAKIATTLIITAGFLFICFTDFFTITSDHNIVTCIFGFWLGILYQGARKKLLKWPVAAAAGVLLFVLIFKHIPADEIVLMHYTAFCLFIVLDFVGGFTCKIPVLSGAVSWIAKISYPMFLLHHVIMYRYMNTTVIPALSATGCIIFFMATLIFSVAAASALYFVHSGLMRLFKKKSV